MSLATNTLCAALAALGCIPVPAWGQGARYDHRHGPAVLPMSSPFALSEAVHLPEWPQIRRVTEHIQTDLGSLALLREMPQIAARYGTESAFVELARKWRDRIPALPERPGTADDNGSSWLVLQNGDARTISVTFYDETPENSITILAITWVGREITNLTFTGGFDHVLGQYHRHYDHGNRPEDGRADHP